MASSEPWAGDMKEPVTPKMFDTSDAESEIGISSDTCYPHREPSTEDKH